MFFRFLSTVRDMSFVKVKEEPKDDYQRMKIRIVKPKPKASPAGLISKPYKQLLK